MVVIADLKSLFGYYNTWIIMSQYCDLLIALYLRISHFFLAFLYVAFGII